MNALSPIQAAEIARGVYNVRTATLAEATERHLDLGINEEEWGVSDRLESRSGVSLASELSGFGYVCFGRPGTRREGEVLIATRGTKTLADWLSNFHVSVSPGPGGFLVHNGFQEVTRSVSEQVTTALRGRNPSHIHCVGHSLGGAIATLVAAGLSAGHVAGVTLYTYGQPRTGCEPFAAWLTASLGAQNIYRVVNEHDPVPMIPIYPFRHVPLAHSGYVVQPCSFLLDPENHYMATGYLPTLGQKAWNQLRAPDNGPDWRDTAKAWLDSAAGHNPILMHSTAALVTISRALQWVIEELLDEQMKAVGLNVVAGVTLLDQLAYLLDRGVTLSLEAVAYLGTITSAIHRFLGRVIDTADISLSLIRWTCDLLFQQLVLVGWRALWNGQQGDR